MNNSFHPPVPIIMSIAGFDPSGGAGTAADLKTFAAHNCYGVAAITAITVQNTQGVRGVYPVESSVLRDCINTLLADGGVKALKIGMVANRANAQVIGEILEANASLPAVLDPVLRSSGGHELVDAPGFEFLRDRLLSRVHVITPNLLEAATLTGLKVENVEDMRAAAQKLVGMGARAVVVTGGHLDKAIDVYFDGAALQTFVGERVRPVNTHGTGCTFSSALAANLAVGRQLPDAVVLAKAYVAEAIRKAYAIGLDRLPLNHLYRMQQSPRVADHASAIPEPVH